MPTKTASADSANVVTDNCPYFDHDIPNAEHIQRGYGVSQLQRVEAFQRMVAYDAVAKDVPRKMWGPIPKALEAVNA